MKKLILILVIVFPFLANGQDYRVVDWKTDVLNVQTINTDTFKFETEIKDYNDAGAITREIGNYFIDFVARCFKIIGSDANTITVVDLEHINSAPQSNQIGRVYQSVVDADSLFESIGGVDISVLDQMSIYRDVARNNEIICRLLKELYLKDATYRQKTDHDSLSALDEKSYNSLTDKPASLPASDVYLWAKAGTKPTYTKSEVGLGNVDNTSDASKPISTATQTALNAKLAISDTTNKWQPKGSYLTSFTESDPTVSALVKSIDANDTTYWGRAETDPTVSAWAKAGTKPTYTKSEVGLGNVDNTSDASKPISTATQTALNAKLAISDTTNKWQPKGTYLSSFTETDPTVSALVKSIDANDTTYWGRAETDPTISAWAKAATKPTYTKSEVGLGNVDNTSDASKPISTATQTALNAKLAISDTTNKWQPKGTYLSSFTETDPTVSALVKSIDATDTTYWGRAETDPTVSALVKSIDANDTTYWGRAETDPTISAWAKAATKPTYTKSDVGLGSVDNTSDANKPISTATQTALNAKLAISDTTNKWQPKGTYLTSFTETDPTVSALVKSIDANDTTYWGRAETDPTISAWAKAATKPTYTKSDVGLGSVDNTSDANKPISTATQTALNAKLAISDTTNKWQPKGSYLTSFTETDPTVSALVKSIDANDTTYWGRAETDPTVYAWAKAATKPTYTKSEVGLGNVDNTSDASKPISTATQTALNAKLAISDTTNKWQPKGSYLTSFTESDPTVSALVKSIDANDTTYWGRAETDPTVSAWAKAGTKPTYTKSEVGLGNVDNTSDASKPISTATQTALNAKLAISDTTNKWQPKGTYLSSFTETDPTVSALVKSIDANDTTYWGRAETDPTISAWAKAATKPTYTKSEVGLGNVDNTSDASKPISTATQTALNAKLAISDTTNKWQPKGTYLSSFTETDPTVSALVKSIDATDTTYWGRAETDPTVSALVKSIDANDTTYWGRAETDPTISAWAKAATKPTYTKSDVGLGSVDNTSDANKPISTATQTALNAKLAISDTTNKWQPKGTYLTSFTETDPTVSALVKSIDANDTTYWGRAETDPTISAWAKAATKPTYTKSDVGLGSVDNTSDANKPISTATQTALNAKLAISDTTNKWQPKGSYLTSFTETDPTVSALVKSIDANDTTYWGRAETDPTVYAWAKAATKPTYTKSEVGLGNVDNTSDASKPISTATQTALNNLVPYTGAISDLDMGANSISTDTVKINGVPLLLNTFKSGNLGGAGNIFYSTGASSQPASGSVNQVIGGNALTTNYLTKWDGSKFANSLISEVTKQINVAGVINTNTEDVITPLKNKYRNLLSYNSNALLIFQDSIYSGSSYITNIGYGFGYATLQYNSGASSHGFGHGVLQNNTGAASNGFGHVTLQNNTGANSNGFGYVTLQNNTGANSNGFGTASLQYNTGANSNGFGYFALRYNTGANSNGFGTFALHSNNYINAIGIGHQSTSAFLEDVTTTKNFTDTEVTANTITFIVAHGFGANGTKVNLKFKTVTGTPPTGLANNGIYQFTITSATVLTLAGIGTNASLDFEGSLTKNLNITNSIAIGTDVNATKQNQIVLGSSNYAETLLFGNVGINKTPTEALDVNGNVIANVLKSGASTGTPPLVVASTTKVDNLNVELLDGKHASDFELANVNIQNHIENDADTVVGNEIQDLSRTGNILSLSGDGTTVDLSDLAAPDLSGYATTTQLANQLSQTITNGVTTKAPSEDAVYDALAGKATISGTTGYISKITGANTLGNSQIRDNGVGVSIGIPAQNNNTFQSVNNIAAVGASESIASEIGAQTYGYWNTQTYTGTLLRQFGSSYAGTIGGITAKNLGALVFQNTDTSYIYTNGLSPIVTGVFSTPVNILNSSGNSGFGTLTPAARVHSQSTTTQLRLGYDATKYTDLTTGSTGNLTIDPVGDTTKVVGAVNSTGGFFKNGVEIGSGGINYIGMTMPTGLSVSPANLTANGTFTFGLQSGYSIPTTTNQTNWNTAYNERLHSVIGSAPLYLSLSSNTLSGFLNTTLTNFGNTTPSVGYPYWNGSSYSYQAATTTYTLPTASNSTLGGIQVSSTDGGLAMNGNYLLQKDNVLTTRTPEVSDEIAFYDISAAAQGKMTLSTLGSLIGTSGGMVYPGVGIPVSTGSAWSTSKTAPSGAIVGTTDSQALTNKSVNGVTLSTIQSPTRFLRGDGTYERINVVQTLTSAPSITMDIWNGSKAVLTLATNSTITITNVPDGGEGSIEVTSSGAYTLALAGSTGYTTTQKMGTVPVIASSAHTTVFYWRSGTVLYYGFLLNN